MTTVLYEIRLTRLYFLQLLYFLQFDELDDLVHGSRKTINVLATGLSIVGLTTTTALDELGSLTDEFACIEVVILDHVVGEHHREQWAIIVMRAQHTDEAFWNLLTHFKDDVFC